MVNVAGAHWVLVWRLPCRLHYLVVLRPFQRSSTPQVTLIHLTLLHTYQGHCWVKQGLGKSHCSPNNRVHALQQTGPLLRFLFRVTYF